jgi:ATP-dependent Clp protease ATP-binding subunit ClpA
MSEYMERHTVSRLIGAPPGYVGFDQGGLLTEAVTKHPHAVLLLDEIEKAHPDVFNLLLQVMDHGTLTDNNGRKADFRNVVLVMTTNAGAEEMAAVHRLHRQQDHSSDGMEAIKRMFTPEFRNRLDAIIQFKPLAETIKPRGRQVPDELEAQLDEKKVSWRWTTRGARWLAEHGYDPKMGARPMARTSRRRSRSRWPRSCCSAGSSPYPTAWPSRSREGLHSRQDCDEGDRDRKRYRRRTARWRARRRLRP